MSKRAAVGQRLVMGLAAACFATSPLPAQPYTIEDAKAGAHLRTEASVVANSVMDRMDTIVAAIAANENGED